MTQQRTHGHKAQRVFRIVIIATLIAAFGQITLGGIVRVTGSGLGCPDWPLCHGQLIPPFEVATLIEYTHRLSGSTLGILVIATTILAWVFYRSKPWVVYSSIIALVMVVAAGVLGGITVLTELTWWVRLIHLAIAEALVGAIVFAAVAGWGSSSNKRSEEFPASDSSRFNRFVLASVLGTLLIILSGSYMVGYGAGSSCGTWPLCNGSLFPQSTAPAIHMGHRFIAAIVGIIVVATVWLALKANSSRPEVARAGGVLGIAFSAQILFGAVVVWGGFSPEMKALHLSIATIVWTALMFLTALVYTPLRIEFDSVKEKGSAHIPPLEGLTS